MSKNDKQHYSDFTNVENTRNYLAAEEAPEGFYGSSINKKEPVQNKSTPWHELQRYHSAYNYPNKDFHDDRMRKAEGAHPLHDHPGHLDPQQEQQ